MIVTQLLAAVRRWMVYNRTVAELSRLNDRDLNDLGIAREDIRSVARDASAF